MGSPKPNSKKNALNNGSSSEDVITIRGARQHNLKNVDLSIPCLLYTSDAADE